MNITDIDNLVKANNTEKEDFISLLSQLKQERQSLYNNNIHIIKTALDNDNKEFVEAFSEVYPGYFNYEVEIDKQGKYGTTAYSFFSNFLKKNKEKSMEQAIYNLVKKDFFINRRFSNDLCNYSSSYVNSNAKFSEFVLLGAKNNDLDLMLPFLSTMSNYDKKNSVNSFGKVFLNLLMKKVSYDEFHALVDNIKKWNPDKPERYKNESHAIIKSIQDNLFSEQNVLYAFHLIVSGSINKNNEVDQIKKMDYLLKELPEVKEKLFSIEKEYQDIVDIDHYMKTSKGINNPVLNLSISKGQEAVISWFIDKGYPLSETEISKVAGQEKVFNILNKKYDNLFNNNNTELDIFVNIKPAFEACFIKPLKTNTKNLDNLLSKMNEKEKLAFFDMYKSDQSLFSYLVNKKISLDDSKINCVNFAISEVHIESVMILFKHNFPFNAQQRLAIGRYISKFDGTFDMIFPVEEVAQDFAKYLFSLSSEENKAIYLSSEKIGVYIIDHYKKILEKMSLSETELISKFGHSDITVDYLLLKSDSSGFSKKEIIEAILNNYESSWSTDYNYCQHYKNKEIFKEMIEIIARSDIKNCERLEKICKNLSTELSIMVQKVALDLSISGNNPIMSTQTRL